MYEFINPPDLEKDVALDSLISFDVVGNDLIFSTLLVTVNGNDAYSGTTGFDSDYSGINSSVTYLPSGSIFGEDAYRIVIDPTIDLEGYETFTVYAAVDTLTTPRTTTWQFSTIPVSEWSFSIEDYIPPWIENNLPTSYYAYTNVDISVDILDDFGLSDISVYVNGNQAFSFPNTFYSHYDGPNSSITPISGGYTLVIDPDNLESATEYTVLVNSEDINGNTSSLSWTFRTIPEIFNTLYMANSGGLYAIEQENLVGECQSELRLVLSTSTTPSIPINRMSHIHGIKSGFDLYLALSMGLSGSINPVIADQYGTIIVKNEIELFTYSENKDVAKAQLTDNGILYYINKTDNTVDCYHGAINSYTSLDYSYSSSSTPPILSGEILSLFILNGDYTKLYIGTDTGLTVVSTNDYYDIDGYSVGLESTGTSITYSISSGSGTHKIIGGNSPEVRDVTYINGIILVVTDEGITQILEEENRKIYFMDSSSLPSTTIRKISNN